MDAGFNGGSSRCSNEVSTGCQSQKTVTFCCNVLQQNQQVGDGVTRGIIFGLHEIDFRSVKITRNEMRVDIQIGQESQPRPLINLNVAREPIYNFIVYNAQNFE